MNTPHDVADRARISRRPGLFLILVTLFAPWFLLRAPGTSFSLVDLFLFVAIPFVLFRVLMRPECFSRIAAASRTQMILGAVFVGLCLLSGIQGNLTGSVQFSTEAFAVGLAQYAFVFVLLPILACWYITPARLWWFVRLTALGYLLPVLATLLLMPPTAPEALRDLFIVYGRACGPFGNPNTFATVLSMLIPFYLVLAIVDRGSWRWVGVLGTLLSPVCLVLTASFGGLFVFSGILVVNTLAVLVWHAHPVRVYKGRTLGLASIVVVFTLSILALLVNSPWIKGEFEERLELLRSVPVGRILEQGKLESVSRRIVLIHEAFAMIDDRKGGLWGHGLSHSTAESVNDSDVHVTYLLLWIEGGLLLLLAYLALVGGMLRNIYRLMAFDPAAATAIGLGLLGILLFACVNPHIYLRFFWIPVLPAFIDWKVYGEGSPWREGLANHVRR